MVQSAVKFIGAAVLASTVIVATSPAEARSKRYYHRDRVDAGDVLAGIVLIGAIAAIAGSAGKSRDRNRDNRDYRYDPPRPDNGDYRGAPDRPGADGQWVPGGNSIEARAVDACSWAAEGELGDNARVGQIDGVNRDGDGWRVTGAVAAPESMPRDFSCLYRNGRAVSVTLD